MPFGFTPEIPNIPGLSSVTSAVTSGFSESSKSAITDLANQSRDSLFQNPMSGAIGFAGNSIDSLEQKLTLIASGDITNNLISISDATTFLSTTGISDLKSSLSALSLHTDRLSGVLKGAGVNVPGLEEIVTVGKMMNTMTNLIDGAQGCLNIIGGATGIFSQDQVSSTTGSIASIIDRIDKELVTISEITDVVLNAKNAFTAIVNKDTNFLGQCVEQLKTSAFGLALSTAMSDPCAKFILEQTAVPSFLTKLQLPPTPSIGGR
jgi:hypothetical protein